MQSQDQIQPSNEMEMDLIELSEDELDSVVGGFAWAAAIPVAVRALEVVATAGFAWSFLQGAFRRK